MIVPVLLTFSNGEKLDAEFTMPKKAYWQGRYRDVKVKYNVKQEEEKPAEQAAEAASEAPAQE